MKSWTKSLAAAADPKRATEALRQLQSTDAAPLLRKLDAEPARILCALLSGSQVALDWLLARPDWLPALLDAELLKHPRREQGLRREIDAWLRPLLHANDFETALNRLREFKRREMLRLAARDLARLGTTQEVMLEISNVADVCLDTVLSLCRKRLTEKLGLPYHQDADGRWHETRFAVVGLGKLGGQELNYSSDIDVLFLYSAEGTVCRTPPARGAAPTKGMASHAFFVRLSEAVVGEISRMTDAGSLFRIDLRLRPEGDAGPLARSLDSYENYYAQWGQTWERMMLLKARHVAGDKELTAEFLEMVQTFRYPRSLYASVLHEVAATKARTEREVVKEGELERNVKLGRGGIREIEFIAQTLQLLHAGRFPFLQGSQTLPALEKLVSYALLPAADATALTDAYLFLRDVEHRLQMEAHQQTHTIPTQRQARERLARLMGFETLGEFERVLRAHTARVRRVYDEVLGADDEVAADSFPDQPAEIEQLLAGHCFREPAPAAKIVHEFVRGPGYVHVSPRTVELAHGLLRKFLSLCPPRKYGEISGEARLQGKVLSDPDRVLVRLESFIGAYGARAALYELWTQHPSLFELLLLLFDRSEFLAETAIRTPDLVDALEIGGHLRRQKDAAEVLRDLRYGLNDKDQSLWLRRYHQTEHMRIGLRDILGLAEPDQCQAELSALADACLQYALEVVTRRHQFKHPPFCVIGLGKLGGCEIDYGSDLDIVFVAGRSEANLPKLQRLAIDFLDLLSTQTEAGLVFRTDARLRPDGDKGLLVNSLAAYEEYYRRRAHLWEIQALTRSRPVAGDPVLGGQFQSLAQALTNFTPSNVAAQFPLPDNTAGAGLAAYTADWKKEIAIMRERIARERTPRGKDDLAIKTGAGGLIDAEFLAQTICVEQGWHEPNTTRALTRACAAGLFGAAEGRRLVEDYRRLRHIAWILRRWSFEGEELLPDVPAPLYRVAVRCGFGNAEAFMAHVRELRHGIAAASQS